MFKLFLISAYRNLIKNKLFTIVNITGLTTGFMACLFITLFVLHESSYDSFFDESEDIYRVALKRIYPDRERLFASSPVTIAPVLSENYDEVLSATRLHRLFFVPEVPVTLKDQTYIEDKFLFADSNFFKVFTFEFIAGDPSTVLNSPDKVVLTESTAKKYFGNQSAINQTFLWDTTVFIISGIIKDVPAASHMDFDLLGSINTLPYINNAIRTQSWINPWLYTYIKLNDGVDYQLLQDKLPGMVEQYGSASIAGMLGEQYTSLGHRFDYFLQPIEDIHLHSDLTIELQPNSKASYLYILSIIAGFILIISTINYVNIATARSVERSKEVCVRKVLGSSRNSLIGQFLTESICSSLLAMFLALLSVYLLSGYFNNLLNQQLDLQVILNPFALLVLVGISVLTGIVAGLYPSLVLSNFQSAVVLKGAYKSSRDGIFLRNGLIGLQFFISLVMISGVLFVGEQMNYLSIKNLGFVKENVLVIKQAGTLGSQLEAFKTELKKLPQVISVGAANSMPGDFIGSTIYRTTNPEISDMRANLTQWDDDYMETMNMQIVKGRGFGLEFNDSLSIIINESALIALGIDDPIGLQIRSTGGQQQGPLQTIVGVVEDYNFYSLHTAISPLVLTNSNFNNGSAAIAIRINAQSKLATRKSIESIWNTFVPQRNANISFLSEELETLYTSDKSTAKVFGTFTIIAIILACIGLFGLATYTIQQRTREIGIRKVLGATQLGILRILVANFIKILAFSLLIAIPLTYWAIGKWLENFAYHVDINPFVFLKAGFLTGLLILLAVGYQAIKISNLNPTETLRTD